MTRYQVRFKKIAANHDRLRDDVIEGYTYRVPALGEQFVMYGPGRDNPDHIRIVNTSKVTSILPSAVFRQDMTPDYTFTTESRSMYRVDILKVEEQP